MNQNNGYIYIRSHESYDIYNAYKLGKTKNIPERNSSYITGEIKRGYFKAVYEVCINQMDSIEKLLQCEFYDFNIKYDEGGTEFYNKKIITLIEPYLKKYGFEYRKLTKEEIDQLVRCKRIDNNKYKWDIRNYQNDIIKYSKKELLLHKKIYIELPTGGGKSLIVYNLLNFLESDFIIIISPRKIINEQNISSKYLQLLNDKYDIFNYSKDNNFNEFLKSTGKKIIICCTQSVAKIYENNIPKNTIVWFDEAHWAVEDWIGNSNKNFWLFDNDYIKYRIFTSASPNKLKVKTHEDIFGKLYSPIKVKELINLSWLSKIYPYIYSENIKNINNINYLLNEFKNKNRTYGFSFHNKQKNAFNLFYKHYIEYKFKNTDIKPFLLISNEFDNKKESQLDEIKLDYDYRDIKNYENTINSIGYVVAKYNIGYDFNKIDFIYFSDPKLSSSDIIQSIGRGLRSDRLGEYGKNKEKILVLSIPIYIDIENKDYSTIREVLKYLIYDIELEYNNIKLINKHEHSNMGLTKLNDYDGNNNVDSTIWDILGIHISYKQAKKIIAENYIKNKYEYYKLCRNGSCLPKHPEAYFKIEFTNWIDYLSIERIYYDLVTCKIKVGEYLRLYSYLTNYYLDMLTLIKELCKLDELFPPYDLWVEYYNVNDLRDIINISNKKKNMGAIL
jgi:superfamily II DNA or RNA helicase